MQLTLEQKFKLELYRQDLNNYSREQLEQLLLDVISQGMVKDNYWKKELKIKN